ncbi:hypothetical protein GCM10011391_04190 [Pullulanibacillus camelliae]|uniref:Bleomycin resistance protein n=1 Tax=Pullulanibacillus camelliae TaxID=1707096 RepID=A0A8J2YBS6_9BACL|nr:VOC family protein [Pullulanibacillus camelliae]GGE28774.1 hypothetical protein GCM10011391_04190 [Pullulanibacillus camelliae]
MQRIESNEIVKIGLVVEDIHATVKHYAELFDIEMPEIVLPSEDVAPPSSSLGEAYTLFRGKPVTARTKIANIRMGAITLELLEPLDDPSPWKEFKDKNGPGVHFITLTINGFEKHIEFVTEYGLPLIHKGEYGSGRYCLFDSVQQLGVTLGLQELGAK